jgi:hypothetical protein
MTPAIEIRKVVTAAERRNFIRLPWQIHRGHRTWIPPLLSDEQRYIDPSRNLAFRYCDAALALAYRDGIVCGRIMGIINHRHNTRINQRVARFGNLECPNDHDVAERLLQFAEEWARFRRMDRIVGPMGFTDQDPEGYLVEGFEHEPTIGTYANFPFMSDLLRDCGYTKEVDYVVYKVPVPAQIPESYERVVRRIRAGGHVRTYQFRHRSELKPFAERILSLMNETFSDLYGYVPLDEDETKEAARRFLPILDPRLVNFATVDGNDAAFLLAMRNIDEGLRKANGRLFPLGLLRVMNAARRTRQVDLLVGGVKAEYRKHGLAVLGMAMLLHSAREAGMETIDSHLELESNLRIRAEMERMGGTLCKRYRIYTKPL